MNTRRDILRAAGAVVGAMMVPVQRLMGGSPVVPTVPKPGDPHPVFHFFGAEVSTPVNRGPWECPSGRRYWVKSMRTLPFSNAPGRVAVEVVYGFMPA